MDYKFLNKVLDQIVYETRIDYDKERLYGPYLLSSFPSHFLFRHLPFFPLPLSFSKHCRDVYGLNDEESDYIWEEYNKIIKDKIDG